MEAVLRELRAENPRAYPDVHVRDLTNDRTLPPAVEAFRKGCNAVKDYEERNGAWNDMRTVAREGKHWAIPALLAQYFLHDAWTLPPPTRKRMQDLLSRFAPGAELRRDRLDRLDEIAGTLLDRISRNCLHGRYLIHNLMWNGERVPTGARVGARIVVGINPHDFVYGIPATLPVTADDFRSGRVQKHAEVIGTSDWLSEEPRPPTANKPDPLHSMLLYSKLPV